MDISLAITAPLWHACVYACSHVHVYMPFPLTECYQNCKEALDRMPGEPQSGIYTIKPDRLPAFDVQL